MADGVVQAVLGLLRRATGWHFVGLAVSLSGLAAALHWGWEPSAAVLSVASGASIAAGLAVGSGLDWLAKRVPAKIAEWRRARLCRIELLSHLPHLTERQRGILGAYLASGLRKHYVALADRDIRMLLQRGLLERADGTGCVIPEPLWDAMQKAPTKFPAGTIPPPTGREWMIM